MMDDLTPVLSRLPEPMPPPTLTATVMARIEREAERNAQAVSVPVSRLREVQTWLWTFAGVALVVMAFVSGWLSTEGLGRLTAVRLGIDQAALTIIQTRVSQLLALGLVAYVAGLFAPLRTERRD